MLWIIKRLAFTARLRWLCKKRRHSLIALRRHWIFGDIQGGYSDFCVVTSDMVYSVKLAASHHRRLYFCFDSPTRYGILSWRFPLRATWRDAQYRYHCKPPYHFGDVGEKQVNILLFSPTPSCVFVPDGGEKHVIGNGDWMGEAVCYGEKGFLKLLDG